MVWIPITASENYDIKKESVMAKEYKKPVKLTNEQKRAKSKRRKEQGKRRKQGTGRGKATR